jgi:predicted glutamine amidotransferase
MTMNYYRKFFLILALSSILILLFLYPKGEKVYKPAHNCRFWGMVYTVMDSSLADTVRTHLDSLRALSVNNADGWGFGYFLRPDDIDLLGFVTHGEPIAQNDPRYLLAVEDMIKYAEHCGIGHVRSGSSGPSSGIPDPHPFYRESLNRDFKMILAHNGNIPVKQLLDVIYHINPLYLRLNPPDYAPDHIDSDLYAILIMETIDTYLELSIEECIQTALFKIDSAIGLSEAKFNFVMTDGTTMWALNYDKSSIEQSSLYLYPNVSESRFWVAASTPLDTFNIFWAAVANSTLVVLNPNVSPRFIRILEQDPLTPCAPFFDIIYPNPFKDRVDFRFCPDQDLPNPKLKIFDINGRLVKNYDLDAIPAAQSATISWDGTDIQERAVPSGIYYCILHTEQADYTRKIVLMR